MLDIVLNMRIKGVRIRRFSDPYFPTFGLNTEIYNFYTVYVSKRCLEKLTKSDLWKVFFFRRKVAKLCIPS